MTETALCANFKTLGQRNDLNANQVFKGDNDWASTRNRLGPGIVPLKEHEIRFREKPLTEEFAKQLREHETFDLEELITSC